MARDFLKDPKLEREMLARAATILKPIEEHGWDGDWYLAGWSDFNNPVGSKKNKEGRVYLNTQTWAALTGIAKGERLAKCWKAVDEMLDNPHGSLTLTPHYTARDENVGRVRSVGTVFEIRLPSIQQQPLAVWLHIRPATDRPRPSVAAACCR